MEKKQLLPIAWGAAQLHAKLSGQIGIWESIFWFLGMATCQFVPDNWSVE